MPTPQFFIAYDGNKYQETKQNFNLEDYMKYDTFIEPYGGTYGFSRAIYEFDNTKKFIIYDNDEKLINFYKKLQKMDSNEFKTFMNGYNDIMNDQQWRLHDKPKFINRSKINAMIERFPKYEDMFHYNLLKGRFSSSTNKKFCTIYHEMMKNCTFIHKNAYDIKLSSIDKPKTLIYLDPPYLLACNTQYSDACVDHTQLIHKYFASLKHAKCMFVHSNHFLLDITFHNNNNGIKQKTYQKRYNGSKKTIDHDVFENIV